MIKGKTLVDHMWFYLWNAFSSHDLRSDTLRVEKSLMYKVSTINDEKKSVAIKYVQRTQEFLTNDFKTLALSREQRRLTGGVGAITLFLCLYPSDAECMPHPESAYR